MKEIQLTQGQVAIVDDDDFESLNRYKWHALKCENTFYAIRTITVDGKRTAQYMHCIIMNRKGIDHIDRNGINNQKSNLRFCSQSQNCMNQRKQKNSTSVYKGVSFFKRDNNWKATITINRKLNHLGYFASEVEAAKAYNTKAIELFCEFANLNKFN